MAVKLKQIVKIGCQTLNQQMTVEQAARYGKKHLPKDLASAGFNVIIYQARQDINGWNGLRINYGKQL